jgi:hypothetical protein
MKLPTRGISALEAAKGKLKEVFVAGLFAISPLRDVQSLIGLAPRIEYTSFLAHELIFPAVFVGVRGPVVTRVTILVISS